MSKAYLSLGSNMGDKQGFLEKAVSLLNAQLDITVSKLSSFYQTAPVGYLNQDEFLNQVIEIETHLSPDDLLAVCQEIEKELKRERTIRFGPRTIDLDILLYDDLTLDEEHLIIPHPRMIDRAFVMIPLFEINKNLLIKGQSIKSIVDDLNVTDKDIKKVQKIPKTS